MRGWSVQQAQPVSLLALKPRFTHHDQAARVEVALDEDAGNQSRTRPGNRGRNHQRHEAVTNDPARRMVRNTPRPTVFFP